MSKEKQLLNMIEGVILAGKIVVRLWLNNCEGESGIKTLECHSAALLPEQPVCICLGLLYLQLSQNLILLNFLNGIIHFPFFELSIIFLGITR